MSALARLRLLAGLLLCLVVAPVPAAMAHAQLLTTNPTDNAILQSIPDPVELVFNEPVSPLAVRLIGPDGEALDLTGSAVGGIITRVGLPADLMAGTHVMSWRVVSTDGHPISGSLVFSVGTVSGSPVPEILADPAVSLILWAGKALLFLTLFVGVGGAAFQCLAQLPQAARQIAKVLSVAGVVIAPATLGLQGLDALGLPLSALSGSNIWGAALSTSYGAAAIVATLALAMSTMALRLPARFGGGRLGLLAAALAAVSLASSGHASAAYPQWVTRPAVFLHISGVIFWVGALVPLWVLLRARSEPADRALASFSKGIPFAVAPLVLSGIALGVIQMGAPGAHWFTPYGYILAAKLVLLAVLFALAVWNRLWLTDPALSGNAVARHRLRRSIGWEMVLIAIILALVAGWRFTPPPRALMVAPVAADADPIMVHLVGDSTMAMVMITPGAAGPVTLDILISDLDDLPKQVQAVSVSLADPDRAIEPIQREAVLADGMWEVEGLSIPLAGNWQIGVEVRLSRFELARLQGEVTVPAQ